MESFKADIAIRYWAVSTIIYLTIKVIINRDLELYRESINGIKNGFRDISQKQEELWLV